MAKCRRRTSPSSPLSTEIIQTISKSFKNPSDILLFRRVCKKWRKHSGRLSPNILSPLLPRQLRTAFLSCLFNNGGPLPDHIYLVTSSIYLITPIINNPDDEVPLSWLVMAEEINAGKLQLRHPLKGERLESFPKTLDLTRFKTTELARGYNLRHSNTNTVMKVILCCSDQKRTCAAIVLYGKGILGSITLRGNGAEVAMDPPRRSGSLHVPFLDDVVSWKGKYFAVDRRGRLWSVDCEFGYERPLVVTGVLTPDTIHNRGSRRKRLVVDPLSNKLYLVVWEKYRSEGRFKIYSFNEGGKNWDNDEPLGDDGVLFVGVDHCFFASASVFPGHGNCIIFDFGSFPRYKGDDSRYYVETLFSLHLGNDSHNGMGIYNFGRERFDLVCRYPKLVHMFDPAWFPRTKWESYEDKEMQSDSNSQDDSSKSNEDERVQSDLNSRDDQSSSNEVEEVQSDANSEEDPSCQEQTNRIRTSSSALSTEIIQTVSKSLKNRSDILSFQQVCKRWRKHSVPLQPNILSPLLPYQFQPFSSNLFNYGGPDPVLVVSSVYLITPIINSTDNGVSLSWLVTAEELNLGKIQLWHPINGKRLKHFPKTLDLNQFKTSELALGYNLRYSNSVMKVVLCCEPGKPKFNFDERVAMVLHDKGDLGAIKRQRGGSHDWESTPYLMGSYNVTYFDDVVSYKGKYLALDRLGRLWTVDYEVGYTIILTPQGICKGGSRRKRLVVDPLLNKLYLVVRVTESEVTVYRFNEDDKIWDKVDHLGGDSVLFVGVDHCFFASASVFPGLQGNCVIFAAGAFPRHIGNDSDDSMWIYHLGKVCGFPLVSKYPQLVRMMDPSRLKWDSYGDVEMQSLSNSEDNPFLSNKDEKVQWDSNSENDPSWHEGLSSSSLVGYECHEQTNESPSTSAAQENANRTPTMDDVEHVAEEGIPREENMRITSLTQSNKSNTSYRVPKPKDSCEDEEMQSDSNSEDVPSLSNKDKKVQSNSNSKNDSSSSERITPSLFRSLCQEQTDESPSTSVAQGDVNGTPTMNDVEHVAEEGTPMEEMLHITSLTRSDKINTSKVKFEGLDISSDLVPTLEKIWSKHGNIIENSSMRNSDTIAGALELLANTVLILESNSLWSLKDSHADYLSSALSDLECMRFRVDWLVPFVEKAVAVQKSQTHFCFLDQLSQYKAKLVERRSKLIDKVAEIDKWDKEIEEIMADTSEMVPFSPGEVDLYKPLGGGLT